MEGRDKFLTEELSWNLPEGTEDKHWNLSGQFIPKLIYKLDTSHIQAASLTAWNDLLHACQLLAFSITFVIHAVYSCLCMLIVNTPWSQLPHEQCFPHSFPWLVVHSYLCPQEIFSLYLFQKLQKECRIWSGNLWRLKDWFSCFWILENHCIIHALPTSMMPDGLQLSLMSFEFAHNVTHW
jgi:hypothetical protein